MPTHSKCYYFGQYSQFLGHLALGKGLDLEDMASGLCPEKIAEEWPSSYPLGEPK